MNKVRSWHVPCPRPSRASEILKGLRERQLFTQEGLTLIPPHWAGSPWKGDLGLPRAPLSHGAGRVNLCSKNIQTKKKTAFNKVGIR